MSLQRSSSNFTITTPNVDSWGCDWNATFLTPFNIQNGNKYKIWRNNGNVELYVNNTLDRTFVDQYPNRPMYLEIAFNDPNRKIKNLYIYKEVRKYFEEITDVQTFTKDGSYRYSFQGQEHDDEVAGKGNSYTAQFWQYDSRLGRRWNIDPMSAKYPWQSPYATFNNNPIFFIDPLGLEGTNTTGEKEPRKESRKEKKERQQKMFGSKDDGVDLDEVQVLPSSPAKQEKPKSKGYEWMSGASMKNFFGSSPSLGREGKGVFYTDKTNPHYEDWLKGRENHEALEGFIAGYAGGSLAAPVVIFGAVISAPAWTPYLAMGANSSMQMARAYHFTFGVNGGYANLGLNWINQSYVSNNWGLDGKSITGLIMAGSLRYNSTFGGQMLVGGADPWLNATYSSKDGLTSNGYFLNNSKNRPSIEKVSALTLIGVFAPLHNRVPLFNSRGGNIILEQVLMAPGQKAITNETK